MKNRHHVFLNAQEAPTLHLIIYIIMWCYICVIQYSSICLHLWLVCGQGKYYTMPKRKARHFIELSICSVYTFRGISSYIAFWLIPDDFFICSYCDCKADSVSSLKLQLLIETFVYLTNLCVHNKLILFCLWIELHALILDRKTTFKELLYFVNFNLTIATLLEKIVLLSGVKTASQHCELIAFYWKIIYFNSYTWVG